MKFRLTKIITITFFIIYFLATTLGSVFLVSWGSTNWYKEIMLFFISTPINWRIMIVDSIVWLPINILFWTTLIFIITVTLETILNLIFRKIKS